MTDSTGDEVLEINKYNLSLVIDWIQFADSKANFLLTMSLALFTAAFSVLPLLTQIVAMSLVRGKLSCIVTCALTGFYLLSCGLMLGAILRLISVVKPRLLPKTLRHFSPFFYQTISMTEVEKFKKCVSKMDNATAVDELADQTYNNAHVATEKYVDIKSSICLMIWSGVFGIPSIAIAVIWNALTHPSL